jgi:hypothetical protein
MRPKAVLPTGAALAAALLLVLSACASSKQSASSGSTAGKGSRVLEAVVVDRSFEPSSGGGPAYGSSGTYYLDFEAQDGGATAHYRFPVTYAQYQRYTQGTPVQLVLADDRLREIRPVNK